MNDARLMLLGNFHATHGSIPLADDLIATAQWFRGWGPDYLSWPRELWDNPAKGVPCQKPEANAFHVAFLAWSMERTGRWVGGPLLLRPPGKVVDGNHRLRAVQWLAARGVEIEVPIKIAAQ